MIERKEYLEKLKKWKDKDLIKVITGIRRCGKSTLFEIYIEYLKSIGIEDNHIISVNLENPDNEFDTYKELYKYVKEQIKDKKQYYVFLDEVQDTTSSQYELIKEVCNCESLSVIAVGDLKQRIMIWAGAMPNAFDVFKNDFGADEIGLIHNYRSAHELVEMQNNIAAAIDGKKDACISKCMTENGACTIIEFSSQEEEAAWISEYINNALTS